MAKMCDLKAAPGAIRSHAQRDEGHGGATVERETVLKLECSLKAPPGGIRSARSARRKMSGKAAIRDRRGEGFAS